MLSTNTKYSQYLTLKYKYTANTNDSLLDPKSALVDGEKLWIFKEKENMRALAILYTEMLMFFNSFQ